MWNEYLSNALLKRKSQTLKQNEETEMKHYVVGFTFNRTSDKVLLVRKNRPEWQAGKWNGIGGKIEPSDPSPLHAMDRETKEETNTNCAWELVTIFTCPGGTVYFYRSFSSFKGIWFEQMEDEKLKVWRLDTDTLPDNIDPELKWVIPLYLSNNQLPIHVHQEVRK